MPAFTSIHIKEAFSIPRRLFSKLDEVFRGDKDCRSSPRLGHLLKSNATPSDAEVIAIRALITGAEASVEKLRRVPARDDASQVIESQLLETIEAYRALLSPVRYLPSEILQEIFFHYADNRGPNNVTISTMPWRLGHISHRWRKIALSLPSLWDNLPKIYLSEAGMGRSYARALICLLRRSGTSPTLKLNIGRRYLYFKKGYSLTSIIKKIMLHSERIEQLCIEVNATTMPLIQRFKGCLPNLQILRVLCSAGEPASSIDVFETAPALRQVAILATLQQANRFLLPWSQITHFEDETDGSVGNLVLLYPSSLRSLTKFHIYRTWYTYQADESALLYPYRSTTLPNLRTLRIVVRHRDYKDVDLFLESLTIPAVEVIKIHYMNTLIPHLISMISGSCGLSRLQKLAFRTIPLQTGELSALLKLTPHLIELDIDIPPAGDLLRLIYSEGEVMLVPMLQALYMHIPVYTGAQIVHLDTLAQVRCELGFRKDSEDATILSLRPQTWTTLHTFRIIFDSRESRKSLRKRLNNWSSSLSLEEAKAVDMLGKLWFPKGDYTDRNFLKNILSRIESYEITNKVLHETDLHIELRNHFGWVLKNLPGEDKLKQRVTAILVKWEQLLLNDFSGGGWARTLSDFFLVYVSKSKFQELRMSPDAGLSTVYGLNLFYENWLESPKDGFNLIYNNWLESSKGYYIV